MAICAAIEVRLQLEQQVVVKLSEQDMFSGLVQHKDDQERGVEEALEYVYCYGFLKESTFPYYGQIMPRLAIRNVCVRMKRNHVQLWKLKTIKKELKKRPILGGYKWISPMHDDFQGEGILYLPDDASILASDIDSDHLVLIIGLGYKKEPNGDLTRFFIVRNSYGKTWGSGGYGKIDMRLFFELWAVQGEICLQ